MEDRWVFDWLEKIVETKRLMGWQTSSSYEIVRLLKLQLLELGSTPEVELLRQIIKGGVEESIEEILE